VKGGAFNYNTVPVLVKYILFAAAFCLIATIAGFCPWREKHGADILAAAWKTIETEITN